MANYMYMKRGTIVFLNDPHDEGCGSLVKLKVDVNFSELRENMKRDNRRFWDYSDVCSYLEERNFAEAIDFEAISIR